jgi:uncharacterized protein involved in outer membrane biogenesis
LVSSAHKWLLRIGVAVLVLFAAVMALLHFVPSDEELAARAAAELEAVLGVKVSVGALHWHLRPVPVVVMENIVIAQPQPITFRQLTLFPDLGAALHRRIKLDNAELDGAVVPQLSLRGLGTQLKSPQNKSGFVPDELPLDRFVFRNVSWISRRGIASIFDGELDFDPGWRPRTAELRRPEFKPLTSMALARQGLADQWDVRIKLGGGTADGTAQLQTQANGQLHLSGKLKPHDVEVSSALEAFNRRAPLAGKASGETTLSADGESPSALAQSLQTKTSFVMGRSKLLRFDLDKAIKTAGKEHAGQTPLDGVTGRLETQNTADGMVINFRDIHTTSGAFSASGEARLFNRHINAEFAVDLVEGVVGVPLTVSGPVSNIKVSVPPGAVAGAVVGTAMLPGIGTAIGARIGAAVGKIFGSGTEPGKSAAPTSPKSR